eukprot:CAMPEP_0117697204 /NCGR_PEP_ID=MMETSP0804-20121206/29096_1 /TAXON_ID=1074897 /ORGANISM="Tetraselmis astigmatica, Strain CCMP880" /LENGTH=224 /DNA_ID=CAMNT_0005511423 /DNA_START=1229 /DNA_END=1903 /DNA_ORIENTATION=-
MDLSLASLLIPLERGLARDSTASDGRGQRVGALLQDDPAPISMKVNHCAAGDKNDAEEAKEVGNACFKQGLLSQAIQHYSRALDLPVPQYRLLVEGPRRSIYHSNRAAAYIARAGSGGGKSGGEVDDCGHLEGRELGCTSEAKEFNYMAAQLDCESALGLDNGNSKARYRLVVALKEQGKTEDALSALAEALERVPAKLRAPLEELQRSLMPPTDEEDALDELD